MKNLTGSFVAVVTPMHDNGDIDYVALQNLINWQIEQGSDGIVIVGTTGESATVDEKDHCEIIRRAVEFVAGRVPVIAGTGANATDEAIRLTQCAADSGVDACLLVTPYYNKPTQEGLFLHYKRIAEAVDVPQILYNVPGRTCCDMLNETVLRLAKIDNIIGFKDATGDLDRLVDLRKNLTAEGIENFLLYSGDDASSLDYLLLGGDGVITVTGNVAPKSMHIMVSAALDGDKETAISIDKKLQGLHKQLFIETSPIPTKWALYKMGFIGKGIRLPMTSLQAQYESAVTEAMKQADINEI